MLVQFVELAEYQDTFVQGKAVTRQGIYQANYKSYLPYLGTHTTPSTGRKLSHLPPTSKELTLKKRKAREVCGVRAVDERGWILPKRAGSRFVTTQAGRDLDNAVVARTGNTLDGRTLYRSVRRRLDCIVVLWEIRRGGYYLDSIHWYAARLMHARTQHMHSRIHTYPIT